MRKTHETFLIQMHSCQNNSKKSKQKKNMHIPSGYSLFTQCSFDATKNKLDCYRISNGSTYDYRFIINELAKEFKGQFECLGENTEKYITLSVPIKKELDNGKTIICKLNFIDSLKFMLTLLSKLVNNLSGIYKKECRGYKEREKKIRSVCDFIGPKINKLYYKCYM